MNVPTLTNVEGQDKRIRIIFENIMLEMNRSIIITLFTCRCFVVLIPKLKFICSAVENYSFELYVSICYNASAYIAKYPYIDFSTKLVLV